MFTNLGFFGDILDTVGDVFSGIVDSIGDAISTALDRFFGGVCYYIVAALCELVKIVYNFFAVFSGLQKVEYDGSKQYLINVFFGNKSINNIYWGMALIGIIFVVALSVIAVVKKLFDLYGKQQQTYGMILTNAAKSILTILLLSAVLSAVLNITNLLVDRVGYIFDNADTIGERKEMVFTDKQYATMARIYNTIGNYSVNESYNSRYNLNSCYNEIRGDLLELQEEGVFDFYYDDTGDNPDTWQSMLQKLVRSSDPRYDVKIDDYDGTNTTASTILEIMEILKTNSSFYPVEKITRERRSTSQSVSLDRVIFLMGTMTAARNNKYNEDPALTDGIRGAFYDGTQSIYNKSQVSSAFNIGISGINYLMIGIMAWFTLKNLTLCIFNCISRIFNLLGLYIIAPPIIATSPLDGGEKFKQWITSAVVQTFSIFGTIIPMRLILIFIPMVLDTRLVLFPSSGVMNLMAKALLIVGSIEASNRFGDMVTGILANNAGYAAIRAGDMKDFSQKAFSTAAGVAKGAAGAAADFTGAGAGARWLGRQASETYKTFQNKGGVFAPIVRHYEKKEEAQKENVKKRQEAVNLAKLASDEKKYGVGQGQGSQQPHNNSDLGKKS